MRLFTNSHLTEGKHYSFTLFAIISVTLWKRNGVAFHGNHLEHSALAEPLALTMPYKEGVNN